MAAGPDPSSIVERNRREILDLVRHRTAAELGKRNPQDWPDGSWAT